MNILYIAYSCSPNHGSEDKIGWNIPFANSEHHTVYVITKAEHELEIEQYLKVNNICNISFYYVDIPTVYKKVFKGFFYSGRLRAWQSRALLMAKRICKQEKIDIIHQITPVEFRSIGNYYRINGPKYICGPIAGGQKVPEILLPYCGKYRIIELLRGLVNSLYRFWFVVTNKLSKCDLVLFANNETRLFLEKSLKKCSKSEVYPDVSTNTCQNRKKDINVCLNCKFIVVGRVVYLKGLSFLFDALRRIPKHLAYECKIVGDGPQLGEAKELCEKYSLLSKVSFMGEIPHNEMIHIYDQADVLIMPSFREATGSVILEAMECGKPVIAMKKYGASIIIDEECGWLYDGKSKEEMLDNFVRALTDAIEDCALVSKKSEKARQRAEEYSWAKRVEYYDGLYNFLIEEDVFSD